MRVIGDSKRVKALFSALLMHLLIKCHQIKSIRNRHRNPGSPFFHMSTFMAIVSDSLLFINLFLWLLQYQAASALKP